jgi:hypothetical protein
MRTRTNPVRALAALGLTTLLGAALAGCLKVDGDLSIEGDTVSGTLVTALDKQAAEQLQLDPEEVFATENDQLTSLDGVSAAAYDDGTSAGTELTFDQVRIEDLNQLSEGDPDGLRIVRDQAAGTYQFSLVMDFAFISELAEDQSGAGQELDVAALLAGFQVTVAVTFPGEVTEHTGELSGTTVTWHPQPGERTELRAVAHGAGGGPGAAPDPSQSGAGDPTGAPGAPTGGPGEPDLASGTGDGSGVPTLLWIAGLGLAGLAAAALAGWWFILRPRWNQPPGGNPTPEPDVE